MPLVFKLFFFFLSRTEPGTNRIRHFNSKTQKITTKYLMDKFSANKRSIMAAKKTLIEANIIKKHNGWYYFNPYISVRYVDRHHYYRNEVLELFQ